AQGAIKARMAEEIAERESSYLDKVQNFYLRFKGREERNAISLIQSDRRFPAFSAACSNPAFSHASGTAGYRASKGEVGISPRGGRIALRKMVSNRYGTKCYKAGDKTIRAQKKG